MKVRVETEKSLTDAEYKKLSMALAGLGYEVENDSATLIKALPCGLELCECGGYTPQHGGSSHCAYGSCKLDTCLRCNRRILASGCISCLGRKYSIDLP